MKSNKYVTPSMLHSTLSEMSRLMEENLINLSNALSLSVRANEVMYKILLEKGIVTEEEVALIAEKVDREIEIEKAKIKAKVN